MGGDAVFKLFATLGLDTSEYDESLDNSEKKGSNFGKGLKTATKVAAGAIAAVTASTVAGTKAFIDGVSSVAKYGDNVDKMSQKMNMSAEAYQEWDFIMQHCGTSIETMKAGIKTLSNAVESGNGAFERLGISQEQIASMSSEELFGATIKALQGVEDETERTYLAGQLLGRGATELGALLNMTAEDTEDMKKQAHELGGVMSDEAVKSSARFQDSLQNMQTAFDGLKRGMLTNFLPSFSTVMDGLSLVFSGDSKSGLGLIKDGIKNLAKTITDLTPTLVEVGGGIVDALSSAIVENLPEFIESGLNAVGKFVDGIIDNADTIITAVERIINIFTTKMLDPTRARKLMQTAINIVVKLVNGIAQALPQLIPAVVSIIVEIVRVLTEPNNLKMLIQCATALIIAIANGLLEALPELIAVIPELVGNLTQALIENFPTVLATVIQLLGIIGLTVLEMLASLVGTSVEEAMAGFAYLGELIKGWIANAKKWLSNARSNVTNGITNFWKNIGDFFTNGFNNIKEKVTEGLNNVKQKFTSIFDNVKSTVKGAVEFLKGLFKFDWQLPKIKLPHFKITGKFSLDPTNLQMPKISVSWYKKAMDTPYILEGATIFGKAGDKLLGGGESGSELIVGTNKLMKMIRQATGGGRDIIINIYGAEGQDIRELAKEVSKEIQYLIDDEESVYA